MGRRAAPAPFRLADPALLKAEPRYLHPATVERWVDADTVELTAELPFHIKVRDQFRLYGIDAAEKNTPAGQWAIIRVNMIAPPGTSVTLRSLMDNDSFGRWLAIIIAPGGINIGAQLIEEFTAVEYYGGKKPPLPPWPGPPKELRSLILAHHNITQ
jgi:endonuclease YncB( thermonuclease family)